MRLHEEIDGVSIFNETDSKFGNDYMLSTVFLEFAHMCICRSVYMTQILTCAEIHICNILLHDLQR